MQDVGNRIEIHLQRLQILLQILEGLHVLLHLLVLRVGDEDDAVHAAQHELARGVVNHLAGHGVELELRLEALDRHRLDGQEVEEERAVGRRGERDELALVPLLRLHMLVDLDEVGGFAAERRTVENDLHLQLFGRLVDDGHNYFDWLLNSAAT